MHECGGVRSSTDLLDRMAAARDLWPRTTLGAWLGESGPPLPERVLWPETTEQVDAALRAASEAGVSVTTYGAGSGVCGGATGQAGAWVLDTKALNRIGPIDSQRWVVEVEAGVNGQQLEDWLQARGFTLGHSPSSISCSTVGGWGAARSAGQFSSLYGVFEDMVLAVEGVAPGHGTFRVGEGGDAPSEWLPLLLGSEGTLAVLTRFWLRVWPVPKSRWLRGYRFDRLEDAVDAMRCLMQAELWPSVVRLYDPVDTRIGGKTRPKKEGGGAGWLANTIRTLERVPGLKGRALTLPLGIPWIVNRALDGIASGTLLIVGFEGDAENLDAVLPAARCLLEAAGEDLGEGPGERWFGSRHAVSYKLMPVFMNGGFADTMEIACRWSDVLPTYHAVRDAVRGRAVVMAHMSHAYPEGASIYFSFAGRGDPEVYASMWDRALAAVAGAGGTVTHHHGVGRLKAAAASREVGPAVAGWTELKHALDPAGILNPGAVFVSEHEQAASPMRDPLPTDGLVCRRLDQEGEGDEERMWPWTTLPAPPRWQRNPWQVGWTEVSGSVGGVACRLGRGPRSAAGPDLRGWLASNADGVVTVAVPSAPRGSRWCGEGRPDRPWKVARDLLRSGLRPAILTVEEGTLRVGFRGPAAASLGAVAGGRVPGGLHEVPWAPAPLPHGPLTACGIEHEDVVMVTCHGAWRPDDG